MMGFQEEMDAQDKRIKEMEERLGQPWQTAVLDLINAPCADAIDELWNDLFDESYGTWEYPGQAYRHLAAEIAKMKQKRDELLTALKQLSVFVGRNRVGIIGTFATAEEYEAIMKNVQAAIMVQKEEPPTKLETDGHYERCPQCGKFAVHLATSAGVRFYSDYQDQAGDDSQYMDENIEVSSDVLSMWAHICFECEHVVDVGMEPRQ